MRHLMIDLETLSTQTDAVIIAIGVVEFNADEIVGSRLFRPLVQPQIKAGRHIDWATVQWWNDLPDNVRNMSFGGQERDRYNHLEISHAFHAYGVDTVSTCVVWGNGAEFDLGILGSYFTTFGVKVPWHHKNSRCYRTLKNLLPHITAGERHGCGPEHDPVGDAVYQAEHAIKLLKGLPF